MKEKIAIKTILQKNGPRFKKEYNGRMVKEMREHIITTVEKSLSCGDIEVGYAEYICLECGENKKKRFTCKSKFFTRSGRLYTLKWVERQQQLMLKVTHRHSVFTIPEELRIYFYRNRKLLKELMDGVYGTIDYWYKKHKSKKYEVGVIAVLHTFATKYIGRYLGRAAIAEYRIEAYDGEEVTFWYIDHDTEEQKRITVGVLEYIGK